MHKYILIYLYASTFLYILIHIYIYIYICMYVYTYIFISCLIMCLYCSLIIFVSFVTCVSVHYVYLNIMDSSDMLQGIYFLHVCMFNVHIHLGPSTYTYMHQ